MTWAHSGSSDSHFREFRAASFDDAFFAHAVEDKNLGFGKRRNKHVLGCEGQISPGCMDVCLMQYLCRGNVLTYSDPVKAGHCVLCERQHRLDKKLEVCSPVFPTKVLAIVLHFRATPIYPWGNGSFLSLRTVRRVYSLLCWGLLQCSHVNQCPLMVVGWVRSEGQNRLHSKLWFSGLGGHWCDHQPQELVVALCSRAQLGMAV